jgi:hypothetical protein
MEPAFAHPCFEQVVDGLEPRPTRFRRLPAKALPALDRASPHYAPESGPANPLTAWIHLRVDEIALSMPLTEKSSGIGPPPSVLIVTVA